MPGASRASSAAPVCSTRAPPATTTQSRKPTAVRSRPLVPAVILAAGLGKRLASLTNGGPKALLEVNGRTLLERAIAALEDAGYREVIVVTGHAAERIRPVLAAPPDGMTLVERWNPDYATANNIVSILAAADAVGGGFTLLNCDIAFDASILRDVAGLETGNWLVVDGDEPLGHEEMKVTLDENGHLAGISKLLDPSQAVGEYIGICRFDAAGTATRDGLRAAAGGCRLDRSLL